MRLDQAAVENPLRAGLSNNYGLIWTTGILLRIRRPCLCNNAGPPSTGPRSTGLVPRPVLAAVPDLETAARTGLCYWYLVLRFSGSCS
jgi:hypothetical protein